MSAQQWPTAGMLYYRDENGTDQVLGRGTIIGLDLGDPAGDMTAIARSEYVGGVREMTVTVNTTGIDWFNLRRWAGLPFFRLKRGRWRRARR